MNADSFDRIVLAVTVTVRSPFLFPGLDAGRFGLDAAALRDAEARPLIPSDQMRGVLRHALQDIADAEKFDAAELAAMFGKGSADAREANENSADAFSPARGQLHFSDLVMQGDSAGAVANRVRIDNETRAADRGGLLFVELVAEPGHDVEFKGQVVIHAARNRSDKWIRALRAAATRVSAIGAMKTAGYGEVVSFDISEDTKAHRPVFRKCDVPRDLVTYRLTIDRPFLVNARRAADNVYAGSTIIPGGALKGLLARHLELMGKLDADIPDSLNALAISHARVEGDEGVLPLSLVAEGTDIADALCVPLGEGAMIGDRAAAFSSDWKSGTFASARRALGRGEPVALDRSVRMHVEIARETGTAEDQRLFIANAVDPGKNRWIAQIDFEAVKNEDHRRLFAGVIEAGMDGLGRTGARVDFERVAGPANAGAANKALPVGGVANRFAIVLQTDAVMVSPSDAADAKAAYDAYWNRVCPGVTVENFYASQRLAGGYIARRFGSGAYSPFWLTEAGSVFLLSGEGLADRMRGLLRSGLPAPVIGGKSTTWQTCPFQPENGYGAISADYDPSPLWEKVAQPWGKVAHV